jgi:hypothetical protein
MSIEKKSLISTLKTTKKANLAGAPVDSGTRKETIESIRALHSKAVGANLRSMKAGQFKSLKAGQFKSLKASQLKSLRATQTKSLKKS